MGFSVSDIQELREYLSLAKEFAPFADEIVDTIAVYGPTIVRVLDAITNWSVETTTKMIKQYEQNGFTRAEAILLSIDNKMSMRSFLQDLMSNKKE